MEHLNELNSIFLGEQISIPLWEMIVFVLINTICLLFGRTRMGLLISYSFVFYWGFILNLDYFVNVLNQTSWGMSIYAFSGVLMFGVALVGFFVAGRD